MTTLQAYAQKAGVRVRTWGLKPEVHLTLRALGYLAGGFFLSAARLAGNYLPLPVALVLSCRGYGAMLAGAGGLIGYSAFWGDVCQQGYFWIILALPAALLLADRRISSQMPLLLPTIGAAIVAASGVIFQQLGLPGGSIGIYLLRIGLVLGAARLLFQVLQSRNPMLDWIAGGLGVLALCQVAPTPWLNPGFFAAGMMTTGGAFPGAVLAGLALDLGQICPMPMTAVLALGYLVRFLPRCSRGLRVSALGFVYISVMLILNMWQPWFLPALLAGGVLGVILPLPGNVQHRRGETGVAQVRLEMAAGVLAQTRQLLMEVTMPDVDEDGLIARAAERACAGCAYRKTCKDARRINRLPGLLLHKTLLSPQELPIVCRRSGRFLAELHRAQEQLRSIRADRERQKEYRTALSQQYRFLGEFLQDLSDGLARRPETVTRQYTPHVSVFGNRPEADNGDRCAYFAGTGSKYYVLLCDGMGTGMGAVREGQAAVQILQRLLGAGFPAQYALRSLNSLCALRDRAGAVTVDLAEISLDTGRATLFKWGAAPSYLLSKEGAERIGQPGPPPGLAVEGTRESVELFSLKRGEYLILASDGVDSTEALACCMASKGESVAELATRILHSGQTEGTDDATLAIIRLTAP